jgi:hypothetical protein
LNSFVLAQLVVAAGEEGVQALTMARGVSGMGRASVKTPASMHFLLMQALWTPWPAKAEMIFEVM